MTPQSPEALDLDAISSRQTNSVDMLALIAEVRRLRALSAPSAPVLPAPTLHRMLVSSGEHHSELVISTTELKKAGEEAGVFLERRLNALFAKHIDYLLKVQARRPQGSPVPTTFDPVPSRGAVPREAGGPSPEPCPIPHPGLIVRSSILQCDTCGHPYPIHIHGLHELFGCKGPDQDGRGPLREAVARHLYYQQRPRWDRHEWNDRPDPKFRERYYDEADLIIDIIKPASGDASAEPSKLQFPTLEWAARAFAEAWAKWHEHSGLRLDDDLIHASNDILEAMGLEMVEDENGKQTLVPKARAEGAEGGAEAP